MARRAILVVLCAAGLLLPAPGTAGAGHQGVKKCAIVSKGTRDYRVRAMAMKCDRAERGAKRFLRTGEPLTGFTCTEADERTPFFCKREQQAYWAVRL